MSRQDFVLLIMNCEKYRDKAQKQKDGWLKSLPPNLPYFHVIGNPTMKSNYKFEKEVLYVKTPDDYCALPQKVIAAYYAIHTEYEYKYIFKTDDDQFLTNPSFFEALMRHLNNTPNIHYGGKIVTIQENHISKYWEFHSELPQNIVMKRTQYCNGRFYILSCNAVRSLLTHKPKFKKEYFEDYAIGLYLLDSYKYPIFEIANDVFVDYE